MSQQVCSFFMVGNCRFGAACPYLHDVAPTASFGTVSKSNMPVCYYYQQGICLHGDQCFYQHTRDTAAVVQEPCWYLRENGWCGKGQECRFSHDLNLLAVVNAESHSEIAASNEYHFVHPSPPLPPTSFTTSGKIQINPGPLQKRGDNDATKCVYFAKGHCMRGDKCCYVHDDPQTLEREMNQMTVEEYLQSRRPAGGPVTRAGKPTPPNKAAVTPNRLSECTLADLEKLKKEEEGNILRRVPTDKLKILESNTQSEYHIEFHPTDPEWEFSISELPLIVILRKGYPQEKLQAYIESNFRLPSAIVEHLNKVIADWIDVFHNDLLEEDKVLLYFRTFLKWFDKNIAGLFSESLEVHREQIAKKMAAVVLNRVDNALLDATSDDNNDNLTLNESAQPITQDSSSSNANILQPTRRGIELFLRNLQLREPLDTFWFPMITASMQCSRCKQVHVWRKVLEHGKIAKEHCSKCGALQLAAYRAALMFPSSAVMGFLDVEMVQPMDVIFPDSRALLHCSQCDIEFAKDNLERLTPNEPRCQQCHSKAFVAFDGIRFTKISTDAGDGLNAADNSAAVVKIKKLPKDPFIREGHPLPSDGSCKHFRQSYRWFRFPCCGRAFPCDVCHNETVEDSHEAMFASKVICGFCSKEQQQSSDKPCIACHKYMTKRLTHHWEGGKGCRDKVKMNRNDAKKYANSNKTVPKKNVKMKS